ncbi:hypothetical protein [Nafulsella turpanensis]|uniref:hypothetical protein n=1 Tax=Nafulsella turpanensis TaxID=1265690 RepID=UPI00034955CA|nr:hypothetical protein [Nafulsella turpanensis]
MAKSAILYWVCLLQGFYFFATGIWPLLHMESFVAISGPKFDLWLVRTVGLLLSIIGLVLLSAAYNRRISLEIFLLAVGSALSMAAIDIYYAGIDRIWNVYLLDALAEGSLVALWLAGWFKQEQER